MLLSCPDLEKYQTFITAVTQERDVGLPQPSLTTAYAYTHVFLGCPDLEKYQTVIAVTTVQEKTGFKRVLACLNPLSNVPASVEISMPVPLSLVGWLFLQRQ